MAVGVGGGGGQDTAPPTVTITTPTGTGSYSTGSSPLTVGGTAADNVGVTQVTWANDRGGSGTATGTTSWSASGIVLQPGTNVVTVTAKDAAGNPGTSTLTVTYDTSAPTVSSTAQEGGATVSGSVTVTANASDNIAVAGVQFLVDGAPLGAEDTTAPYSVTWNTAGVANGQHMLTARARDAAGNSMVSAGVVATVANSAVPGLVAAYSFNEGSGTAVGDSSGTNNTGTLSGASWTTAGRFGNALVFNGTSARVNIPNSASLQLTTGMTLEAWVNPSTVDGAWRDVIYKATDNYYLEATSTNASKPAGGGTFGGAGSESYGTAALAVNTWTHLATTYDGSTLRLYVNGVQVSSQARTGNLATSTSALQIGGDSTYGQYFTGTIDEVRIYNRALSQAEIQSDMAVGVGGGGGQDTTPPTVTITTPTGTGSYSTGSSPLTIGGTAADNIGVTQVTWANDRGGTGTASGTTNWTANGINLQPGTNVVTVTAKDAAGNPGTSTLTVTYTAPDTTPPTVTITTPTGTGSYATASSPLTVGGTAADNVGVTQVTWANDRGGSGTATGTTSWSASGIPLQPGTNVVTVTA